jgi:transcriptional regulator with XRE-family HTH domain
MSKDFITWLVTQRTGLYRRYISRAENNHTVPSVETLEKMARALEMPMCRLSIDGGSSMK